VTIRPSKASHSGKKSEKHQLEERQSIPTCKENQISNIDPQRVIEIQKTKSAYQFGKTHESNLTAGN
jgi:hypothetical protein